MRSLALVVLLAFCCLGQVSSAQQTSNSDIQAYVNKQFGAAFTVVPDIPVMRGDLDGDGVEDIVIVARNQNPLSDEAASSYKVVDPYNTYFGYGDPKVTLQFAAKDPGSMRHLLIAHSWQSETPKAKFVIVNLAFAKIELSHYTYKKRTADAVVAHEFGGLNSVVFWDGKKKYRWEPLSHDE